MSKPTMGNAATPAADLQRNGQRDYLDRERERVRAWRSKRSAAGRDIGRLPAVRDPRLKQACARDLGQFAKSYHPMKFTLPFSADHHTVIHAIEQAVFTGGLFAMAMPRGSGKTTLCEVAAEWAAVYGYHPFILLLGATIGGGRKLLDAIKIELRTNDLLLADFPEACFPIRCLQGINNRAAGQTFGGQPTLIQWKQQRIVLPAIAASPSASIVIDATGLLADDVRGRKFTRPDGTDVRPSLVIPDDPQTDKSARNPDSCRKREEMISGTVLGLAGPGKKISVIMPCTVIEQGDLADRMLDRKEFPAWNGIRTKLLYDFPSNMALWEEYDEKMADGMRRGDGGRAANAFYRDNQAAMDEGARPAWAERFNDNERSALQHAMNKFFRDRFAFACEYQNQPLSRHAGSEVKILTANQMCDKLNRVPRGEVPAGHTVLTAFVDISQDVLWWMVCGWTPDFGGAIVDYGTWPDQNRGYFTLTDLRVTIADALPDIADLEARIYAALDACNSELADRTFRRQDGVTLRITRVINDAGWLPDTVYAVCRQSAHAAILLPSHGKGVGAKQRPISQWQKKEGDKIGEEWIRRANTRRAIGHVTFDTNYWKAFVHRRLVSPLGARGSLAFPGDKPAALRMLSDHLTAETAMRVEAGGRTVDEFQLPPHKPDNHWFDGLVGCAVGASIDGCSLLKHTAPPVKTKPPRPRRRVSYLS